MSVVGQVGAVTAVNLRTVPRRLGSSAVAVVGIAGVVVVLVAVLSVAEGFLAAMRGAGSPGRALVMRSGADSEMTSGMSGPEIEIIRTAPGLARTGPEAAASAELYVILDQPKRSTGTSANVPLRGIQPLTLQVRDDARIVQGRMLRFGTNEVVVGRAASRQFAGLDLGGQIRSGQNSWTVVGVFDTGGSVAETEIWCDARVLQGAYRRGNSYQSVLARLDSPDSFDRFKDWLTSNPQLNVSVRRESEYYAAQSRALTRLIRTIGFAIAGLMGIGAVFGAILTMYTAVASRTREIATLRALGFNSLAVLVSVIVESLALALIGGSLGGLAAYAGFNGYQTSTINFQTFSQVAFAFRVTPPLLVLGVGYALRHGTGRRPAACDSRGADAHLVRASRAVAVRSRPPAALPAHDAAPARRAAVGPPLKWAGGKRWLVPHLRPLWEPHRRRRLVEPFCGGLGMALGLNPPHALLNDANPHVINFYRWLQDGLTIPFAMENSSRCYYRLRARFNALLGADRERSAEAAALFYYLNRTGYNGLCRFNSRGFFNVPFGRYARIAYRTEFTEYIAKFERFDFATGDFASLALDPGDFVYADPPYDVPFRQYAKEGFDWRGQVRLAEWLAGHPGPVVLSNQRTDRVVALYTALGFHLKELAGPRHINCTGDRSPARELLATRNL